MYSNNIHLFSLLLITVLSGCADNSSDSKNLFEEIQQMKVEIDNTKAEIDNTKAEVDKTKAEVDKTKAEVDKTITSSWIETVGKFANNTAENTMKYCRISLEKLRAIPPKE